MAKKEEATEETEGKGKSKKAMMIPAVVLIAGLAGGGYFFMNGQSTAQAADPNTTTTIELGSIVRLKPITLNLSDGRVLKVGIALQTVAKPETDHMKAALGGDEKKKVDPESPLHGEEAKALDEAIQVLGDSTYKELSQPGGRQQVKERLAEKIKNVYHDDIIDVYFTDFVMS